MLHMLSTFSTSTCVVYYGGRERWMLKLYISKVGVKNVKTKNVIEESHDITRKNDIKSNLEIKVVG